MKCATCNTEFDPTTRADAGLNSQYIRTRQSKYCSETCARKAENTRYYATHAETIKPKMRKHMRTMRKK